MSSLMLSLNGWPDLPKICLLLALQVQHLSLSCVTPEQLLFVWCFARMVCLKAELIGQRLHLNCCSQRLRTSKQTNAKRTI